MTNKGERSHFSGMSGETPDDGCPSGRLSKERTKGSPWERERSINQLGLTLMGGLPHEPWHSSKSDSRTKFYRG